MIGLYVNNKSREHFGAALLNGEKTVETRTPVSFDRFSNSGVRYGDRIGIVFDGCLQGTVRYDDWVHYTTKEGFEEDVELHKVTKKYGWDERTRYGLFVSDPKWLEMPIEVKNTGNRTYVRIPDLLVQER